MTRVVIDPGVLVSAFISPKRAAPALLVNAVLAGDIEALVCPALTAEPINGVRLGDARVGGSGGESAALSAL